MLSMAELVACCSVCQRVKDLWCIVSDFLFPFTMLVCVCRIATLLDAKGGGRGSRYQGKAKSFAKRADAEALLF